MSIKLFVKIDLNFILNCFFLDYDESQEPFIGGDANSDGHYYKSMIAAIVVAVVVSVVLVVLVAFYLKRNITYKAIISGRANRSELPHSSKVSSKQNVFSN